MLLSKVTFLGFEPHDIGVASAMLYLPDELHIWRAE